MRPYFVFISLLCLINIASLCEAANVPQFIFSNMTLDAASSPWDVTVNSTVLEGVILTIEPGVTLRFARGTMLTVKGTLIARGSFFDPITVTSRRLFDPPQAGDYVGIVFDENSEDAVFDGNGNYQSGSIVENCNIAYATNAVYVTDAAPYVNWNTIERCSFLGIAVRSSVGEINIRIENNIIQDCFSNGIYLSVMGNDSIVYNNSISRCSTGITVKSSNPNRPTSLTLVGNTLRENVALNGGGLFIEGSNPLIINNIIEDNEAYDLNLTTNYGIGGGLFLNNSNAYVVNNVIVNNIAESSGAGIGVVQGAGLSAYSPVFQGNHIEGNTANFYGGGIHCSAREAIFLDNEIVNNNSDFGGGGISLNVTNARFYDNQISGNTTALYGGGVIMAYSSPLFEDCSIIQNVAQQAGAGISCFADPCFPTIVRCIIRRNVGDGISGGNGNIWASQINRNEGDGIEGDPYYVRLCDLSGNRDLSIRRMTDLPAITHATESYWGTMDPVAINQLVYDRNEDAGLGIVDYTLPLEGFTQGNWTMEGGGPTRDGFSPAPFIPGFGLTWITDAGALDGQTHAPVFQPEPARLYAGTNAGTLYALNDDGTIYWSYPIGSAINNLPTLTHRGRVLVGANDNALYALDQDGTQAWRYDTDGAVSTNPVIASDDSVYFGSADGFFYGLDSEGGLKWSFPTLAAITGSAAMERDVGFYFGSMDNTLYALDMDGQLRWSFGASGGFSETPVLSRRGRLFAGADDGYLYTLNTEGTLLWSQMLAGSPATKAAIASDDTVLMGDSMGVFYAHSAEGDLKWSFGLGGATFSDPVVDIKGRIMVGADSGGLYGLMTDGSLFWSYEFLAGGEVSPVSVHDDGSFAFGFQDNLYYFSAFVPTHTPTATPSPTFTNTPTTTPTSSPTNTSPPTATPSSSPTLTPTTIPTRTPTWTPTSTATHLPSSTPTGTPTTLPTSTATPTATSTLTATMTPTYTATDTPTLTPTASPTNTPTDTPTYTPTFTPSHTPTDSPTPSPTETPTESPTPSPTETPTETPSPTPTSADKPNILLAGYWDSDIYADAGGTMILNAIVSDTHAPPEIVKVEVYYSGQPTGLELDNAGGLWSMTMNLPSGLPQTMLLLELVATNGVGNESLMWPYLDVK